MTTDISPRKRLLAYSMGAIGLGTNALTYFLVPLRAHELGVSFAVIGLLLGMKSLTEAFTSVPVGSIIDRIGPRMACVIGSIGVALGGLAFSAATSIIWLFVIQFAIGLLRPMAWIGGQSYAAGMRGADLRGYDTGRFSFGANIGQMATPLIAGLLVEFTGTSGFKGTQVAFLFMAAFGVLYTFVALALPDVARSGGDGKKKNSTGFGEALKLLKLPAIRVDLMLTFTRLWLPSSWSSFLPVYLVSVGTSAAIAGSVSTTMAVVAMMVSLLSGRLLKYGSATIMTSAVLACSAVGVILTPLLAEVPWVYFSAILVGIGQGLSLPLLLVMVTTSAPPEQRSLALGLRASVNQLGATASPVLTAQVIALTSLSIGFTLAGGLAGVLIAASLFVHYQNNRNKRLATVDETVA